MKRLMKRELDLYQKLIKLKPNFAKAAQDVLDSWVQDQNSYNDSLGYGGICQNIADAFCEVCYDNEINCTTQSAEIGEQHVWAIAYEDTEDEEGLLFTEAYEIDINPYIYEEGSAYTWKKIPEVIITTKDINILKTDYNYYKD